MRQNNVSFNDIILTQVNREPKPVCDLYIRIYTMRTSTIFRCDMNPRSLGADT